MVGSTGSGKSTVVNLLMRYYDADKGAIWINDQNVEEITRDSLRKHVGIVLQDTVLFSDSIRHRIQFSSPIPSVITCNTPTKMRLQKRLKKQRR